MPLPLGAPVQNRPSPFPGAQNHLLLCCCSLSACDADSPLPPTTSAHPQAHPCRMLSHSLPCAKPTPSNTGFPHVHMTLSPPPSQNTCLYSCVSKLFAPHACTPQQDSAPTSSPVPKTTPYTLVSPSLRHDTTRGSLLYSTYPYQCVLPPSIP
jgi:hypothetical protein